MAKGAVSTEQLNILMIAAISDASAEDAFFRGLLDATVYAHVPLKAQLVGRMKFVQFKRPENGELALPFFSDLKKAEFAARGNVAIIAMDGRRFLKISVGANLMLNPNDEWLMLYPMEVKAILAGEQLARISLEAIEKDEEVSIVRPNVSTDELASILAKHLATEPDVEAAYLVEIHRGKNHIDTLMLVIAPKSIEKRIVHDSTHALKYAGSSVHMPSLMSVEPKADPTIIKHGIQIYRRTSSPAT